MLGLGHGRRTHVGGQVPGVGLHGVVASDAVLEVVGVVGGSRSDFPILEKAIAVLEQFGVPCELRVVSAHRTPDLVDEYVTAAEGRGLEVIIAGAGGAAHLAGVAAARTISMTREFFSSATEYAIHWPYRMMAMKIAIDSPKPVRNRRMRPMGAIQRLKNGGPTVMRCPVTASLRVGNMVANSTKSAEKSRIQLLTRNAASRDTHESSSLRARSSGSR